MTRIELVKKFLSYADVKETEAKEFMDSFLNKLAQVLLPSNVFKIPKLGKFTYKKARKGFSTDVISFILTGSSPADELLFPVSSQNFKKDKLNDSIFSLSIDKPVIPSVIADIENIKDVLISSESNKYIELKVDKLIASGEIIPAVFDETEITKYTKTIEKTLRKEDTRHFDFSDSKILTKEITGADEADWDFGSDWEKEFNEDSILNVDNENNLNNSELISQTIDKEEINWNFGNDSHEDSDSIEENFTLDEKPIEEEKNFEDNTLIEDEIVTEDEPVSEEVDKSALTPEQNRDIFEEVNPLNELKIDLSEFVEDMEPVKPKSLYEVLTEIPNSEDFVEVKPNRKTKLILEEATKIESIPEVISEEKPAELKSFGYVEMPESAPFQEDAYKRKVSVIDEKPVTVKESRKGITIWSFLSFVLLVAIGMLIYWRFTGFPDWFKLMNNNQEIKSKSNAVIIERKYDVPVNYPYDKKENTVAGKQQQIEQIQQPIQETGSEKKELTESSTSNLNTSKLVVQVEKKEIKQVVKEPVNLVKVKNNIFRSGSTYVVQVSSWQDKNLAEKELARLKEKGFDAFITPVQLPERGTWYRIKVGGFKTLNEAEKFSIQDK
jgi:hypothetical protein